MPDNLHEVPFYGKKNINGVLEGNSGNYAQKRSVFIQRRFINYISYI
jgi:hypothetical protein